MTKTNIDTVSGNPETKRKILDYLNKILTHYREFEKDIQDLIFYIEEDILWNNQHFLLTIGNSRLQVRKDESDKDTMYQKIIDFCEKIIKTLPTESEISETKHIVSWVVDKNIIPKETIYWRDVNVLLIAISNIFEWQTLSEDIKKLRKIIHKKELWLYDYHLDYEWLKLTIKDWESEDNILVALMSFIRRIEAKHEKEFSKARESRLRISEEEQKDRQKIWATILAGLSACKKVFKWSDFWWDIAILKDMISNYELGYTSGITIHSPWWIELTINKWEDLDSITEKLITFLADIQQNNKEKFEAWTVINKNTAIQNKEENKNYWTDILVWLDNIQNFFPEKDYPSLKSLKEMIENDELAHWSSLLVNIWPAILSINKNDNNKNIKNKILVFLWVLKQMASDIENEWKIDDVYWRDILSTLKGMEDVYWDNGDYQVLMMTIEFWTLWTVRNFSTTISWVTLDIKISDTDTTLRQKLTKFIKELQDNKKVNIDSQALKKALKRINQSEIENKKVTEELKKKINELDKKDNQIIDQQDTIKKLQDEIKQLKNSWSQSAPRSSYRSYNG